MNELALIGAIVVGLGILCLVYIALSFIMWTCIYVALRFKPHLLLNRLETKELIRLINLSEKIIKSR